MHRHGHPAVKRAITEQLDQVEYCFSPWFTTDGKFLEIAYNLDFAAPVSRIRRVLNFLAKFSYVAYENLAKYLTESTNGVMKRVRRSKEHCYIEKSY